MTEAVGGWNRTREFFPDDRRGSGKLHEYALESLPGKYVLPLSGGEDIGKIIEADVTGVVLLGGKRIGRSAWPLYRVLDRPPEDALETHA